VGGGKAKKFTAIVKTAPAKCVEAGRSLSIQPRGSNVVASCARVPGLSDDGYPLFLIHAEIHVGYGSIRRNSCCEIQLKTNFQVKKRERKGEQQ